MSIFRKNREEKKSKFFIREYKIIKQIGEGTYATIYKVQKDNSNEIYVLKQIHITEEDLNDTQSLNDIKNESLILSKIHSPYIVKFYDSFFHKNCLNIITEYCSAGDLCEYLQMYISHKKKMSEKLIWKLFIQICLGLYYLHQHKILHRDIKTKNIFLNEDYTVKIGDLGIAKILENTSSYAHTFIGTPYYLSPELCKDLPYNDKSDVWSLGCVLYEMVTLRHPFEGKTKVEIYEKIINSNYEGIDKHYSLELRRVIDLLLIKDEKKRPKISEILSLNIIKEKARESGIKVPEIKLKSSSRSNHNHHSNNRNIQNSNTNISNTNNSNNNSKNNFNSNNNSKNNFNNNNNYGSNCSSGNFNNNINESINKENNQKKIKISSVEVNYFKYKNEKNNENKEKKQNIQLDNSGKNVSKMLDISSILKQSQDKILNMLSKRKNNSKESFHKDNKEIYNYNNRNINNGRNQDMNIYNQEQMNLNKNINNNKRAISGNSSKRNYISSQYYENYPRKNEKNIIINEVINQNSRNDNSEYYKNYNSNSNNNNNNNNYSNQNIQNNSNKYLNSNLNELNKKNNMNHIINYNNNIKIQVNSNNNKIRKYLTDSKEKEINQSNENSNINNEINSSIKNISNINVSNGHGKEKLQNQKIQLIVNLDEKKKSNMYDIIKKIKQNPIKKNMEINQQIKNKSNVKIEEITSQKNDPNNFTLTENNDMLLFNTNNSEKSNLKMNEEKVKVFNANDTLINKTESQLKKDTISLLNLKKKYLNLLNESKSDMIEISNEVFEKVFKIYKQLDSNPDNIDKIYDEIQNYMIENIPQSDDNENNLYKKFNKAFTNYIFYEIELKDIDKKIEKRKSNSKWYIN